MENSELKAALEALLFITDHPIPAKELAKLITNTVKEEKRVAELLAELQREYEERGSAIQVLEVADGFQMATRPQHGPYVRKLFAERLTMKLSTAAHETLSIIAYKQPLTRAEIEEIRGVEVIAALETLVEKRLVKVVGRKESVGRPLMYGTTPEFLRHFGLRSLEDLPSIDSFTPDNAPALPANPETTEAAWHDAPAEARLDAAADAAGEGAAGEPEQAPVAVAEPQPAAPQEEKPESEPEPAARNIWGEEPSAEGGGPEEPQA